MKNYTTSIAAEKTLGQIQKLLAEQGATHVMTEYSPSGPIPVCLSFKLLTKHGPMPFRLPANAEGVLKALNKSPKVPTRLKTEEQAHRVAWRILFHWLENQISIVEADMADFYQVMLPHLQVEGGATMLERFEERADRLLEG